MHESMSAGLLAIALIATACATPAAPRGRPVRLGPVDATSPSSLEAVRRHLQGTWTLATLELSPPEGGALRAVKAEGTLTYDQYGNLTIDAHTSDPAAPPAARTAGLLSFKGRAVIDTGKSELTLMDLTGNVDPVAALSPERKRRYAFEGELLTLSSLDAAGKVTAVAVWRRR
jgi:hypothetical protein